MRWPIDIASLAADNRRPCSSRKCLIRSNRRRISSSSITYPIRIYFKLLFYYSNLLISLQILSLSEDAANAQIGEALGRVLAKLLGTTRVRRAAISGGDTSGHASRQLGLFTFTALAPAIPGAALLGACRRRRDRWHRDRAERRADG